MKFNSKIIKYGQNTVLSLLLFSVFYVLSFSGCGGGGGGKDNPVAPSTNTTTNTTNSSTQQTVSAVNTTATTSITSATVKYDNDALSAPPTITFESATSSSVPALPASGNFDIKTTDTIVKIDSAIQPKKPVMLEFTYKDEDNNGIIDGTSIKEESIWVMYYDENLKGWVSLPTDDPNNFQVIDSEKNIIQVQTSHFSYWITISPEFVSGTTYSYTIETLPSSLSQEQEKVKDAIKKALETWGKIMSVNFQYVSPSEKAAIRFEWGSLGSVGQMNYAYVIDGCYIVITFNSNDEWEILSQGEFSSQSDIESVAVHEMGHAIMGVAHLNDDNNWCYIYNCDSSVPPIMRTTYTGTAFTDLWDKDFERLKSFYTNVTSPSIITNFPSTITLIKNKSIMNENLKAGVLNEKDLSIAKIKGGIRPYSWKIDNLPDGLTPLKIDGVQKENYDKPLAIPSSDYNFSPYRLLIDGTPTTVGESNVTITIIDSQGTVSQPQTITIKVIELSSIAISCNSTYLTQGETTQCKATGTYNNGLTEDITSSVTWYSSDTSIGTISSSGLFSAKTPGTANITVSKGTITSSSVKIYVKAPPVTLSSIDIYCANGGDPWNGGDSLTVGETTQCEAYGNYSNGSESKVSASWSSSSTSVGTISSSGLFTAKAQGTTNITATKDGKTSNTISISVTSGTQPTNQSPTATSSADKTSGTAPLTTNFTIGYTDPEGKAGTYSLDYGDGSGTKTGSLNSGSTTSASHSYSSAGNYTATLTVTDDQGATGTKSVIINVSESGLTNVVVNSTTITIGAYDHAEIDGDIIDIILNGVTVADNLELTATTQYFTLNLSPGNNTLTVYAVNEGSKSPNTATVTVSNVTSGQPQQIYSINQGTSDSMTITVQSAKAMSKK